MIDLHAHSTISDGTLTPSEIIQLAHELGLKGVALTDHDSIDGHEEAQRHARRLGVNLVKGIEFSVTFGENRLIHLLGLGLDTDCQGFMAPYTAYRKERARRLNPVFDHLRTMGVDIKEEALEPFVVGGYMDRQTIAKYLVHNGYVSLMKYAWINYLDHVPYREGELIDPKTAIDAIHAAGGKAIMAHMHIPIGFKGYTEQESRQRLEALVLMGLDGLEYYYPSYTKEDQEKVGGYLKDYELIASGGSDFHGANRAHIQLGVGQGDFEVPDDVLERMFAR